jgi:hypothetical protein
MATNTNPFYTYSATAGSSKTLQKPQDGGDNNQWGNYINTDLDEIVSAVNALSDKIADANEKTLVEFTATGSAVNHVGITNAAAGNGPTISTAGTDSNVDLNVTPKGTGDSVFTNKIKVDDVIEKTTDHGVEIEGVLVKDSIVKTDDIQEKTTDHGVEIDGVLVKDGDVGVATISSKAGTSVGVTLGTDAGDDFNVGSGKLVVEGDTGNVGIGVTPSDQGTNRTNLQIHSPSSQYSYLSMTNSTSGSDATANGTNILSDGNNFKILNRESGGDITLQTTGTGDVKVNTGNLVIGTAGKGIDFSNQTHSTSYTPSSEVLDHYEEGTWTPVFIGGTSAGSYSMSFVVARYTKIGRVVHVSCSAFNVTQNSAGSGDIRITGLPFTVENSTNSRANVGTAELDTFTFSGSPHCSAQAGDTYVNFKTSATGSPDSVLQVGAISSSVSDFAFNLTYTV